jgi:hypothetical protein
MDVNKHETIQHYTSTQIKMKEQLIVRKDMDVNEQIVSHVHSHPYPFLLQDVPLI